MPSEWRRKALEWANNNVSKEVKSNDPNSKFKELTGLTHSQIMSQWQAWADNGKKGAFLTSCNGFVIQYCHFMKLPPELVRFDGQVIRSWLARDGRPYAWVNPTTQICPSAGDIMIWKGQHVGIALYADLAGDKVTCLYTVEGGQNHLEWKKEKDPATNKWKNTNEVDRKNSYDRIKRKKYPDPLNDPPTGLYTADKLQGWIDIDLYIYGPLGEEKAADDGATSGLWLTQEGNVVHPDAPYGGGGPGVFCTAGALYHDPFGKELPHPLAPAARNFDPLAILRLEKESNKS